MKWDKIITTEQEYEKALARLAIVFEADPSSAEGMEAGLLVALIEKYEQEHYPCFPSRPHRCHPRIDGKKSSKR